MADRFPLILNTSANQIQEIASGDQLDLSGNNIANAGIITATSFSGPVVAGAGVSNITAGIGTYTDLRVGGDTTFSEDFVVTGNARVTGILTVGTSSIILNDSTDTIKVGTALTLGHTQGLQFHTQNLHSAGFDVNQINASGIITSTGAVVNGNIDANGDLDVDGHTNLDNVNVVGVLTVTGAVNASHSNFENLNTTGITIENTNATIIFQDTNSNPDYWAAVDNGVFDIVQYNNGGSNVNVVKINTDGHIDVATNVDFAAGIDVTGNVIASGNVTAVDGTFSGNVSIGGTLTYEDVTNIDSVGIVTARNGIKVLAGGANVVGVVTATTLNAGGLRITDDGASGPIASIMADDGNPWALQIGNSTYSTSYQTGHQFFVASGNGNAFHEVRSSTSSYTDYILRLNNSGNTPKNSIKIDGSDQSVILYAGGSEMLQTTSSGATLLGELNATGANFTDDGQSSPIVSIMSDDANPWGLQVGNSTYNSSTIFGYQVYVNNTGEGYQYHIGAGAYKDFHFYQHNQSAAKLCVKFEADDNSVELYAEGNKKLETTSSGVTVTGTVAATSFSGSGNLSLTSSNSDTNFGDNSAPGGVNGIFVSNNQNTNGVFSALTLSANDTNGTNQNASFIAKSVSGGYVPEVHITQRTGNNTSESNFKITNSRSVQLRHEGNTRLETTTEGVKIGRTMFTGSTTNITNEAVVISPSINTGNGYHDNHVVSIGQLNGNWSEGTSGADTAYGLMFSYAGSSSASKNLRGGIVYDHKSTEELQIWSSYGAIVFYQDLANGGNETPVTCDTKCAEFDTNGHFVPGANNGRDLGTSSKRWRNIYTNDLNLSNEGGVNKVDGTWGNYTIQEGESDLFLINNRNGKKYKFNLTEVS